MHWQFMAMTCRHMPSAYTTASVLLPLAGLVIFTFLDFIHHHGLRPLQAAIAIAEVHQSLNRGSEPPELCRQMDKNTGHRCQYVLTYVCTYAHAYAHHT